MAEYFVANIKMIFIECGSCGVPFAMSEDFIEERRKDHKTWYCPTGCPRHYPQKTEKEKLQEKLNKTENRLQQEIQCCISARDEANSLEMSRRAYKGQVTKLKKKLNPQT